MLNTVANEPCRAMNVELPLAWIESILAYAVPSLQAKWVGGLGIGTRGTRALSWRRMFGFENFAAFSSGTRKITVR